MLLLLVCLLWLSSCLSFFCPPTCFLPPSSLPLSSLLCFPCFSFWFSLIFFCLGDFPFARSPLSSSSSSSSAFSSCFLCSSSPFSFSLSSSHSSPPYHRPFTSVMLLFLFPSCLLVLCFPGASHFLSSFCSLFVLLSVHSSSLSSFLRHFHLISKLLLLLPRLPSTSALLSSSSSFPRRRRRRRAPWAEDKK